jgi:hypothetical protein
LISGWQLKDVASISLKRTDGTVIGLTRNADNSWTRSQLGLVPQGKVEQLLSEIMAVRILLQLPAGQNLTDLGLQTPIATIEIAGTGRSTAIQIGALTPTQGGFYVKVDNSAAVVVDKGSFDTILQLFNDAAPATPTPPAIPEATATP